MEESNKMDRSGLVILSTDYWVIMKEGARNLNKALRCIESIPLMAALNRWPQILTDQTGLHSHQMRVSYMLLNLEHLGAANRTNTSVSLKYPRMEKSLVVVSSFRK